MTTLVPISRVARALGLDRADLRQRIDRAGIPSFEGKVDVDVLHQVAPTVGLDPDDIHERTRLLRENAQALRYEAIPTARSEDLHQQVRELTVELLIARQRVERYQRLIGGLLTRLGGLVVSDDPTHRHVGRDLNTWLAEALREP